MKTTNECKNDKSWKVLRKAQGVWLSLLLMCLTGANGQAQTYKVLHNFTGSDGANPQGALLLIGNRLYGATARGGISNCGVLFRVNTDGRDYEVLKKFSELEGTWPTGGLVVSGSTLYGTAQYGGNSGSGTVFKINTDGSGFSIVYDCSGHFQYGPNGDLILTNGVIYGTTTGDNHYIYGTGNAGGSIYKLGQDGLGFTALKSFATYYGNDGFRPNGGLVLAGNMLYGTTYKMGSTSYGIYSNQHGVIFKIGTDGSGYTVLKTLTNNGLENLEAGLVLSDATLYGMTSYGGVGGNVFKLSIDGSAYTVLSGLPGRGNIGLLLSGPNLYGATPDGGFYGNGTVFMVNTDGSGYTMLKHFAGGSDGATPSGRLILSGTTLYGVARDGGSANQGVVFSLSPGPPTILEQPSSDMVPQGEAVAFQVMANGWPSPDYQWFFNGTNLLSGATNTDLQLTDVQLSQAGFYTAVVTNVFGAVTSAPAMLEVIATGDSTVRSCTEQALRIALMEGSHVVFACDGTITIGGTIEIETNAVFDAAGHQITISGGNSVQVFYVHTNATLTLLNLTVASGRSTDGGGIYIAGGTVNATNCSFVRNDACGTNGADGSYPGQRGGDGRGGAIYNLGTVNVHRCNFVENSATGGVGGEGMLGEGSLMGGPGGAGGLASGVAIYNSGFAVVNESLFAWNSAVGGAGGRGGTGGWYGGNGGVGGYGGNSLGSAIFNEGMAILVNSTFALNHAHGGMGGEGGYPGPRNPYQTDDPIYGPNGVGGTGFGAIFSTDGILNITNCTLADNSSTPGSGGDAGVGGLDTIGAVLVNTLLAGNSPSNCAGVVFDAGHNISSDGTCFFTSAGSLNHTDPMLGSLADNGGSTLTMALLPGSPAIDAGDNSAAPPTDQRGVPRPQGAGADIGAFEFLFSPVFTSATILNTTNRQMQLCGLTPNHTLTLQASTNLLNWWDVTNFTTSANGAFQCIDPVPGNAQVHFYRLKSGTP